MKPRAYIETSMVTYLTALSSGDLVRAAHQHVTREWWVGRGAFELYSSEFVLDEAAKGDAEAASRCRAILKDIEILSSSDDVTALAAQIIGGGGMPANAHVDARHVALAAVHGMDYILTWNCTHIANAAARARIEAICRTAGFPPPVICTPMAMVEESPLSSGDPIIDEIHAIREAISRESDDDLEKIVEAARAREKASGRKVVTLPSRRIEPSKKVC